jgi:cobalt-zinc-cadmium efflux system membrane fusion protein
MRNNLIHILLITAAMFCGRLSAHEGEHGEKPKTQATPSYFSSENSSEKYEVLVKYGKLEPGKEEHLKLFLSDVNTNEPIPGATFTITSVSGESQAFETSMKEPGIYEIHTKFASRKTYNLNIGINARKGPDLILLSGIETGRELPADEHDDGQAPGSFGAGNMVLAGLALLAGLLIGLFINRRNRSGRSSISIFLLSVFLFSPSADLLIYAHGDHEEEKKSNAEGSSAINVSKETQFLFNVTTTRLHTGNFSPSVNLFGTVLPSSSGRAVVQSPQSGIIRSLNVSVGQLVNKGLLLATIEQNIDANTQVSWLTQKNALETEKTAAKKEYDRLQAISDIVAKRDIDEAERRYQTARRNLEAFETLGGTGKNSKLILLYAPIDGRVDNFSLSLGSTVNAGQEILTVTNLGTVYVEAQVFDKDLDNVKHGKEYLVECPDTHHTKKVRLMSMSPSINSSNQSQRVLFEMDNSDGDFKIGEFVNIRVFTQADARFITVPNSAITEINGKSAVFIKDAAEQYSLVYVSTGDNNGQYTTILKGVEENERIVTGGTYQLKMMHLNQ